MSRIGKKPIPIPTGVTVTVEPEVVRVAGPRGDLAERKNRSIDVKIEGGGAVRGSPDGPRRASGAARAHARVGREHGRGCHVGFRSRWRSRAPAIAPELRGRDLELTLGYSHPVSMKAPEGTSSRCPQPDARGRKGNDKQVVGQHAAIIRKQRPPEPYRGKGIRYQGEKVVRRKAGKTGR